MFNTPNSIGDGASTVIGRIQRIPLWRQRHLHWNISMLVQQMFCGILSTDLGVSWVLTGGDWLERLLNGLWRNRGVIGRYLKWHTGHLKLCYLPEGGRSMYIPYIHVENFGQKFGVAKNTSKNCDLTVFGRFRPFWVRIWSQHFTKLSGSGPRHFVGFGCPQL